MPLVLALLVSATVVLSSPFLGQLQAYLRRTLSTDQYVLLFGLSVITAVVVAVILAFVRIRERRGARLALLAVALGFGGAYMWATGTTSAEINAVERVHFVEYGAIAFLFYRASLPVRSLGEGGPRHHASDGAAPIGDPSLIAVPLLAGFVAGTLDELLQWFVPYRVGEAHDVFINLAALGCGVMFAFAVSPPRAFSWRLPAPSARRVGMVAAIAWLTFAVFVSLVHLGTIIEVDSTLRFKSHYSRERLEALQRDRAVRWQTHPPVGIPRLSREDQYLDEGIARVRRRNMAEPVEAWNENRILELFYAPVLDSPTYASPTGHRWPAEQLANVRAMVPASTEMFTSTGEAQPIMTWPQSTFWAIVIAVALLLVVLPRVLARR